MTSRIRPRRSVLYMPGSNPRALEKAKSLPADGLIFDLEDAVAPEAKAGARDQVSALVRAGGYGGRETIIRVNGLATPWGHRRPRSGRERGGGRGADPQGRERRHGAPGARRARSGRGARRPAALVHDGDRARHAARRGDRRGRFAGRLPGHGHLRPRPGAARGAHAASPAAPDRARALSAGGARLGARDSRRRVSRSPGRRRVSPRPAGRAPSSASMARP